MHDVQQRAELARKTAQELGELLYGKQLAYGDSGGMNLAILQVWLEQYRTPANVEWGGPFGDGSDGLLGTVGHPEHVVRHNPAGFYLIPVELLAHLGRLTRCLDRMARIVSNPAGDRMGEDPWRDLAGDAIIGMIMPRGGAAAVACEEEGEALDAPALSNGTTLRQVREGIAELAREGGYGPEAAAPNPAGLAFRAVRAMLGCLERAAAAPIPASARLEVVGTVALYGMVPRTDRVWKELGGRLVSLLLAQQGHHTDFQDAVRAAQLAAERTLEPQEPLPGT